ncbi:MAG: AmmeMemoRadiSam system radical SAM enzyme [Trueperaceae bacterium]|nr:MAG: AmmeMemoRadiSam system radical SAM enzyme [Trueperaceae bacterium]
MNAGREREQLGPGVVRGDWWQPLPDGRIQCNLCPRLCKLREGQHGFCFIRRAEKGGMALSSYGRASGFCIDPIEKKPLNHFYPGTGVLSFGTAGCNLGCRYCQNWDISKARRFDRLGDWASPETVAQAAARTGCRSLAFTYNDPVIFAEYAIDCALAARENGVKTVAVTAGYINPEARADFFEHIDAANVDLKAFTESFYSRVCLAHLQPVLDTLQWLVQETEVHLEITTLLIPGYNDSEGEVAQLCDWLAEHLGPEVPLHLTAFHPDYKMLDTPPTPAQTLRRARRQALEAGLYYVYTGNVHDSVGQSTYCPNCRARIIERNWYQLGRWQLDPEGCCAFCHTPIRGHFDTIPGTWGAAPQPISLQGPSP